MQKVPPHSKIKRTVGGKLNFFSVKKMWEWKLYINFVPLDSQRKAAPCDSLEGHFDLQFRKIFQQIPEVVRAKPCFPLEFVQQ